MSTFQSITLVTLKTALDASTLRHEAISHNIANVNTPRFKRVDVTFKSQLRAALDRQSAVRGARTHPSHMPIGSPPLDAVQPRVYREADTSLRVDESNIDIDAEMGALSQNTMHYSVLARLISDHYGSLESAIRGRV